MPRKPRELWVADCETDPFKHGRFPAPFIWGAYNGSDYLLFDTTEEFVEWASQKYAYIFAHNGGKFDWMFLIEHLSESRVKIINSRLVEASLGKALLRDSFSIIPIAMSNKLDDYSILEREVRNENWQEIVVYLKGDLKELYSYVSRFFDMGGNKATIASNALGYARKLGLNPGRTNHRFDNLFRPFYFGGRVEAFKPGIHDYINVYDIRSAYPYAMSHGHPCGNDYLVDDNLKGLKEHEIQQAFIDITCLSRGAFPVKTETGGTEFPEKLARYKVTGWEYLVARRHGLLSGERINAVYRLNDEISFKPFVDHWAGIKNEADDNGDKIQRHIAKIFLNSLYGKMAQNPVEYFDYSIKDAGTEVDYDNGWQLDSVMGERELHARPVLWRYQQKYGDDWVKCPIHYNVAIAASITGFVRAYLLDHIETIGREKVYYCDTDCLFLSDDVPGRYLRSGPDIGDWTFEGTLHPCAIAGKKLYGGVWINGESKGKDKVRCKGAQLTIDQIWQVAQGETVKWKNAAPTYSIGKEPRFIVRSIRATAHKT